MIGLLKEQLTLHTLQRKNDDCGGYTCHWIPGGSIWGSVTPLQPSKGVHEAVRVGEQDMLSATYSICVRAHTQLNRGQRLMWREKNLAIISEPVVDISQQWLSFLVSEIR